MTFQVLKTTAQNQAARAELDRRGLSWRDPLPKLARKVYDRLRGSSAAPVGDVVKNWDVLETVRLLEQRIGLHDKVADLGAWSSEVPVCLHRRGFTDVYAIDFNANLLEMPYQSAIHYVVGDMMTTPWADGMFAAVTAMSSMEHGFDPERLLDEVVRLLRPGGLFIASTDYWPQKVDTSDVTLYGMTWTIFDRSDVEAFLAIAARKGLHPIGPLDFAADEAPIFVHGKHYTFGWLALEKRAG